MREGTTRHEMTLLVIEHGAEWPAWAGLLRELAPNCAVEAQLPREPYDVFAERLLARLERLREQHVRLRGAGFACALSPLRDLERLAQLRRTVCQHVIECLRARGPGANGSDADERLIIGGGDWKHGLEQARARAELIALWSDLSVQAAGRLVSLRFDESLTSGLFPVSDAVLPAANHLEG